MKDEQRWSPLLPADEPSGDRDYTVRAKVWRWKGGSWHFATLPAKPAAAIRRQFGAGARGWGSIRVRVKIGDTEWNTSLFPERKAEAIGEGDRITAVLHII